MEPWGKYNMADAQVCHLSGTEPQKRSKTLQRVYRFDPPASPRDEAQPRGQTLRCPDAGQAGRDVCPGKARRGFVHEHAAPRALLLAMTGSGSGGGMCNPDLERPEAVPTGACAPARGARGSANPAVFSAAVVEGSAKDLRPTRSDGFLRLSKKDPPLVGTWRMQWRVVTGTPLQCR
ncbi:hypothetical protein GQ53DRAFT_97768 [Thozetella sp. PMI_491]|nr:hypothetical protein GQ53DRAFT_97768 [Thozetella sp. PMI_491]